MTGTKGLVERSPMKEHRPVEHRRVERAKDEDEAERAGANATDAPPTRRHGGFDYPYYFGNVGRGAPPGYPPYFGGRLPPHLEGEYYNPYLRRGVSHVVGGPLSRGSRGRSKSSIPPGRYTLGGMGPERDPGISTSAKAPWEERRSQKQGSSEESDESETERGDISVVVSNNHRAMKERKTENKESHPARTGGTESESESGPDQLEVEREYGPSYFGRLPPGYSTGRGPPLPGGKHGPYRSAFAQLHDRPAYRFGGDAVPPEFYHDPYFYGPPDYSDYPIPSFSRLGPGGGYPFPRRPFPRGVVDDLDREQGAEGIDKGAISDGAYDEYEYGPPPPSHHAAAAEYYARGAGRVPPMRRGGPPPGFAPLLSYGRLPPVPGSLPGMGFPYTRGRSNDSSGDEVGPSVPPHAYAPPYGIPPFYPYRRPPSTESTGDDDESETRGNAIESPTRARSVAKKTPPKKERTNDDPKSDDTRVYCTCKKSRCLKLYCQCFASRQICQETATDEKGIERCRCRDCRNNLDFEAERQEAVEALLQRNPTAFDTKIQEVTTEGGEAGDGEHLEHKVGCKCRRSACLKKYCECFNAKVSCSTNCKCVGCRNDGPGSPSEEAESSDSETQSIPASPYHGSPTRPQYFHQAAMRYGHGPYPPPRHLYDFHPISGASLVPPIGSPSRLLHSSVSSTPRKDKRSFDDSRTDPQTVEDAAKNLAQLKKSPSRKKDYASVKDEGFASPASVTAVQENEHTRAVTNSRGSRHEAESKSKKRRKTLPNTPEKKKLSIPSLRGKESPDQDTKPSIKDPVTSSDAGKIAKLHDEGSAGKLMAAMAMTELLGGKGSCPTSPKDSKDKQNVSATSEMRKMESFLVKPKEKENKAERASSKGISDVNTKKETTGSTVSTKASMHPQGNGIDAKERSVQGGSKAPLVEEAVDAAEFLDKPANRNDPVSKKSKKFSDVKGTGTVDHEKTKSETKKDIATDDSDKSDKKDKIEKVENQEEDKGGEILTKECSQENNAERGSTNNISSASTKEPDLDSKPAEKKESKVHNEAETHGKDEKPMDTPKLQLECEPPPAKRLSEMTEDAKEVVAQASKKMKSEIKHILLLNDTSNDESKDDGERTGSMMTRSKDHVAPVTSTPPPSPRGSLSKEPEFSPGRRTSPRKRKMSENDEKDMTDKSNVQKEAPSSVTRGRRSKRERAAVNYAL